MEGPEEGEAPGARLKFYYCLHNDCLESVVHFENKQDYIQHMKDRHGVRPPPKTKTPSKKVPKKIPEKIPPKSKKNKSKKDKKGKKGKKAKKGKKKKKTQKRK